MTAPSCGVTHNGRLTSELGSLVERLHRRLLQVMDAVLERNDLSLDDVEDVLHRLSVLGTQVSEILLSYGYVYREDTTSELKRIEALLRTEFDVP
ncbi:hypothetical protein [Deinococcus pimensis]|uniref:hypothetical protein n=1 Tax=Deinococcus pimensis TaxID=309888 RepID=UPI000483E2AE|nr:hypothetical protein [Deinococcus pimensis]